jgi:cytochrome c553
MVTARALAMGFLMLAATASASCFDPVHSDAVDALGPEAAGDGPQKGRGHRAGQPCLTCHGGDGPGSPEFSFAGTVYLYRDLPEPAVGTKIEIREVADETKAVTLVSNEIGNFYIEKSSFDPTYPVFVSLVDSKITDVPVGLKDMVTPIGRNGGCGGCHAKDITKVDPKRMMPHVYLNLAPPRQP